MEYEEEDPKIAEALRARVREKRRRVAHVRIHALAESRRYCLNEVIGARPSVTPAPSRPTCRAGLRARESM